MSTRRVILRTLCGAEQQVDIPDFCFPAYTVRISPPFDRYMRLADMKPTDIVPTVRLFQYQGEYKRVPPEAWQRSGWSNVFGFDIPIMQEQFDGSAHNLKVKLTNAEIRIRQLEQQLLEIQTPEKPPSRMDTVLDIAARMRRG